MILKFIILFVFGVVLSTKIHKSEPEDPNALYKFHLPQEYRKNITAKEFGLISHLSRTTEDKSKEQLLKELDADKAKAPPCPVNSTCSWDHKSGAYMADFEGVTSQHFQAYQRTNNTNMTAERCEKYCSEDEKCQSAIFKNWTSEVFYRGRICTGSGKSRSCRRATLSRNELNQVCF